MNVKRLISTVLLCATAPLAGAETKPPAKYSTYCIACHSTGAAGAPKVGDKAAWAPRLKGGVDALVASTKKGKGAMPAMGLCTNCTDEEMKELVVYMSGAK